MLYSPPSIVRRAAFAAVTALVLALSLAACRMDMDESTNGGRISLALDSETIQSINSAGRMAAAGSRSAGPVSCYASDSRMTIGSEFNGMFLDLELTGAVQQSKTIPVQEGASVTFDALPVGTSVRIKGTVWMNSPEQGRLVYGGGSSEPIVIQEGDNQATLPLSLLSKFLPLTLEAQADGSITIKKPWTTLKYTINNGALTAFPDAGGTAGSLSVASGDKICLFAEASENTSYYANTMTITSSGDCAVYGNVMSLVTLSGSEWNPDATELTGQNTFSQLFYQETPDSHIKNHATKAVCLPAVTLTNYCYANMFKGCSGLTAAPALPATTLADHCYNEMFKSCTSLAAAPELPATSLETSCYNGMFTGCTSLTAAPALPATSLEENCYISMFSGCTNLSSAPELPATNLADACYGDMFQGCTSLKKAPDLPATTLFEKCYQYMFKGCTSLTAAPALNAESLQQQCYYQMFQNCSSLTTAPALPATTLAVNCYNQMFDGCSSLTAAPALRAASLVDSCYAYMFRNCSSLTEITCLATDKTAAACLNDWVKGVAGTGTFHKAAAASWTEGDSGIPTGWTQTTE